jgi:Domain of unknown function (DUF6968)
MLIARRILSIRVQDRDMPVEVRLFEPVPDDEAWSCGYEIDWPLGPEIGRAVGVDSIQAIVLALQKVGTILYTSDYHRNAQLTWPPGGDGYGFPVASNIRDLLIGEDLNL